MSTKWRCHFYTYRLNLIIAFQCKKILRYKHYELTVVVIEIMYFNSYFNRCLITNISDIESSIQRYVILPFLTCTIYVIRLSISCSWRTNCFLLMKGIFFRLTIMVNEKKYLICIFATIVTHFWLWTSVDWIGSIATITFYSGYSS